MSDTYPRSRDDAFDALLDAIAFGDNDVAALDSGSGVGRFDPSEVHEIEHAAAAVACLYAARHAESLPHELRLRCEGAGRVLASDRPAAVPVRPSESRTSHEPLRFTPRPANEQAKRATSVNLGWLAAAACLAIAVVAAWPSAPSRETPPEAQMAALLSSADDVTRWDWADWGDQPTSEQFGSVEGEVVWSESEQEGYLVLTGLPVNDPSSEQYQVWVVESSRGTPLEVPPVDGGVFDVTGPDRAVIPIRSALPARDVVAFAVTLEAAGGVVVSDQSRKVVIATAPTES